MIKRMIPFLLTAALLAAVSIQAYAAELEDSPGSPGSAVSYAENSPSTDSIISVLDGSSATGLEGGFYPIEIRTIEEDGEKQIVKTYQVPAGTPVSVLSEPFEKGGVSYEMQEVLKKPMPDEVETKTVSQTVTVESETDQKAKLRSLFDPLLEYSEEGYTGQLQLDAESISAEADGTESYRYLVTETRQMPGLDRNDTYYIPKTVCKNGVQLQLCDVDWTTMGCGAAGGRITPNRFTATARYSGYATGSRPSSYLVTATYTGQVQRSVPGNELYSIVFSPVGDPFLEEMSKPNEWGGTPFFILGAVVLVGAAGAGAWFFWKKRGPRPLKEKTKIYMPRDMEQETGGAEDA